MGCDIWGWIEVMDNPRLYDPGDRFAWRSVVDLNGILPRDYVMFGRLAHDGTRQQPGDTAIFAGRGLPDRENMGEKTRESYYEEWESDAHHETHFTHAELTAENVRVEAGSGEVFSKNPVEYVTEGLEELYNPENIDTNGSKVNDRMKYGYKMRRWEGAVNTSAALAESFGREQVRWVIWFDN